MKNKRIAWNKGLTKKDPRVALNGKNHGITLKRLYKENKLIHPMKGKTHSKEAREKLSRSLTGRKRSKESIQKQKETIKKNILCGLSEAQKKGLQKLREFNKKFKKGKTYEERFGKEKAKIIKKRLSDSHKGQKPWNKGIEVLQMKGEKHPLWKGGISSLRKRKYGNYKNQEWRTAVFKRDNYECQFCHQKGKYLNAHHIKRYVDYPKEIFNIDNGLTLCKECHYEIRGKEKNYEFFCNLILEFQNSEVNKNCSV